MILSCSFIKIFFVQVIETRKLNKLMYGVFHRYHIIGQNLKVAEYVI